MTMRKELPKIHTHQQHNVDGETHFIATIPKIYDNLAFVIVSEIGLLP